MSAQTASLKRLIEEYLADALLLQVATTVDGEPWICTVHFASDSDLNLYWMSRHDTRHSRDIAQNPRVAGAVVRPHVIGDKSRGLQLSGTASEIRDAAGVARGLEAMEKRYGVKPERTAEMKREILGRLGDYGLYRLRPEAIVLLDKVNFPDDPRQVYELRPPVPAHR